MQLSTRCVGVASGSLPFPRSDRSARSPAGSNLAGDPADAAVERDRLAAALGDLRPDARAALVLRHYYGYDYNEIAGFLRTSPGNVGSILSRAHGSLRARLTEDLVTSDDLAALNRAAR